MLELGVESTERLRALVDSLRPSRSRNGRSSRIGGVLETKGVALLTIRAWCEEGSPQPLRAEIRLADDVAFGFRSTLTFVNADEVVDAVRDFLDSVLSSSSHNPTVTPVPRPGHR